MSKINPLHLIIGLLGLVIAVNAVFLVVASKNSDDVVESYVTEER